MKKKQCRWNMAQWSGTLYVLLVLIALLGVNGEVQAAVLLPTGEEYKTLMPLHEIGAWGGDNPIRHEATHPVALRHVGSSGDVLQEVTVMFRAVAEESWNMAMPLSDWNVDRFGGSLFVTGIVPKEIMQAHVGAVDLGSKSPMEPVSSSPSSAVLFVPAVIGLLGVLLRERSSVEGGESAEDASGERSPLISKFILILSQDPLFTDSVRESLHQAGHAVRLARTVDEVATLADRSSPSLIVLDHRVEEWDMLRTHPALKQTPIMTLIPRDGLCTEQEVISDLDRGADGYHDFRDGYRLFVAKVDAYLRRAGHDKVGRGIYHVGAVELDADIHEAKIAGQPLHLSAKPFAILKTLMQAPSRVFSRSELVDRVWGPQFAIGEHTLDVHVHALRQQLDRDPKRLCRLVTIKGVGFKLKAVGAVPLESRPKVEQMALSMSRIDRAHLECESHASSPPTRKRAMRTRTGNMTRPPAAPAHFGHAALAS